jgi:lysosomal alpha-mannosidase
VIENGNYALTFDETSGLLKQITNKVNNINIQLTQNYWWYNSSAGNHADQQSKQ